MLEAERRANRQHPFPHLDGRGVAEFNRRQIGRIDLEQGKIAAIVGADDLGDELAAIAHAHDDLIGGLDHMGIGQDVTIRAQNET